MRAIGAVIAIAWLIAGEKSREQVRLAADGSAARPIRLSARQRSNEAIATKPTRKEQCRTRSKHESRRALFEGDRYLALLAIVLLGYALMGKGFAYLGFPPLYVGEIAFPHRDRRLSQDRRIGRLARDAAEPRACRD